MPTTQGNNVRPFSANPIRTYARDFIAISGENRRTGILAWRIAAYLYQQIVGNPAAELSRLPENDQEEYVRLAIAAIVLTETIDTTAPPTPGEIARYEQRRAWKLARIRALNEARRLGHAMEDFRSDRGRPGFELATCRQCGGGVSIHIETAEISASPQLELPCESTR